MTSHDQTDHHDDTSCRVCGKRRTTLCAVHIHIANCMWTPLQCVPTGDGAAIIDAEGELIATVKSIAIGDAIVESIGRRAANIHEPVPMRRMVPISGPLPAPPAPSDTARRVASLMRDADAAWVVDSASPQVRTLLGAVVAKAEAHDAIRASRDAAHLEAAAHADLADLARAEVELLKGQLARCREERDAARLGMATMQAAVRAAIDVQP